MSLFSFLKTAVRDPIRVGAVMPSSSYAVRRILAQFPGDFKYVIEYGPGDGVITREVLKLMPAGGRLLAIETNGEFIDALRQIDDKRLILVQGDARRAADYAEAYGFGRFDLAFSGIPFSMLTSADRHAVVDMTHGLLDDSGTFVVYQTSPLMVPYLSRKFRVKTSLEPLNVPPYFVMRAAKKV
jgi:phospholipid N-methyltransferase